MSTITSQFFSQQRKWTFIDTRNNNETTIIFRNIPEPSSSPWNKRLDYTMKRATWENPFKEMLAVLTASNVAFLNSVEICGIVAQKRKIINKKADSIMKCRWITYIV